MNRSNSSDYDCVVVGGGQAGLAAGYRLAQSGRSFVILDAALRTGDAWRNRWASLRLFTPARYDSLPGVAFPASGGALPAKDAMADYLETYAQSHSLPVEHGVRVRRVARAGTGFRVEAADKLRTARNLIVAVGSCARPRVPGFEKELRASIKQLHSSAYARPADVPAGSVLVVGFGPSGAEIAMELARAGRKVVLAGRPTVQVPKRVLQLVGGLQWRFLHHLVTVDTPIGKRLMPKMAAQGAPLIGISVKDVAAAGVVLAPRMRGVVNGLPELEDGRVLEVDNVIWCTGFSPDHGFLDVGALARDAKGWPIAPNGVAPGVPGLYFMGVPFQVGPTSVLVGGVDRDARRVVRHMSRRSALQPAPTSSRGGEPAPTGE